MSRSAMNSFLSLFAPRTWYRQIQTDQQLWERLYEQYTHSWPLYHSSPSQSLGSYSTSPAQRRQFQTVLNGVEWDLRQLKSKLFTLLSPSSSDSGDNTSKSSASNSRSEPSLAELKELRDNNIFLQACADQWAFNSPDVIKRLTKPGPRYFGTSPPKYRHGFTQNNSLFNSIKSSVTVCSPSVSALLPASNA